MNANDWVTVLGQTNARQPYRTFGIKQADRLFHTYIIGQTGTGKSTLLANMARQDIANGQGFCLIDPHGDLAESVAEMAGDQALYWDTADPSCPYGYNPLTFVAEAYRPLVASGLIETLKKQWGDSWGPRMEHLLRYAILALLSRPGSSLRDILPMFLDKARRRELLLKVTDEQVRAFWEIEFPKMNYKTAADGVAPIANKLGAFLAHPVIRRAVCEPAQPLRFRQIMDEGKALIINLAKGRLGADTANVLGGSIVSSIALAAYSRQDTPVEVRIPFILYVDEFHALTTSAYAEMLSELRKYRLALVLSHQYTSQLDEGVHEAILGNVGTTIAFRVGAKDALALAKRFGTDRPSPIDLINLPNHQMAIRLMVDGVQTGVFSARSTKQLG